MNTNYLKLNPEKTELLVITADRSSWSDDFRPIELGNPPSLAPAVKCLGLVIDAGLSMAKQVVSVCGACVATIRKLCRLAPMLSSSTLRSVVLATVISCLDYGNALYAGIAANLIHRLQTVQNDAARLIFKVPRNT